MPSKHRATSKSPAARQRRKAAVMLTNISLLQNDSHETLTLIERNAKGGSKRLFNMKLWSVRIVACLVIVCMFLGAELVASLTKGFVPIEVVRLGNMIVFWGCLALLFGTFSPDFLTSEDEVHSYDQGPVTVDTFTLLSRPEDITPAE